MGSKVAWLLRNHVHGSKGIFFTHPLVPFVDSIPLHSIPQPREYNTNRFKNLHRVIKFGVKQSLLHTRSTRNLATRKLNGPLRNVDSQFVWVNLMKPNEHLYWRCWITNPLPNHSISQNISWVVTFDSKFAKSFKLEHKWQAVYVWTVIFSPCVFRGSI